MNTTMSVQLPTDTLLKLIEKLRRRGGSQDLSEAMAKAIECWLSDPGRFEPGADLSCIHGLRRATPGVIYLSAAPATRPTNQRTGYAMN